MHMASDTPRRRNALACITRMMRPGGDFRNNARNGALLDATCRLAKLQGLTCIALEIQDRVLFVLAGDDVGLDLMIEAMTASRWHDGPVILGPRQCAPHMGLARSAVRPRLLEDERRWLAQEVAAATPRHATIFALLDWAILRDLERSLTGAIGTGAPFPALPAHPHAQRLQ